MDSCRSFLLCLSSQRESGSGSGDLSGKAGMERPGELLAGCRQGGDMRHLGYYHMTEVSDAGEGIRMVSFGQWYECGGQFNDFSKMPKFFIC